jgi:rhodanese-related sulfurtransferase
VTGIPTVRVDDVPDPLPPGVTVVDVREPDEWDAGHLAGSVHVPMGELVERVDELPADDQLLVVCRVGGRSAQVTLWLAGQGYRAVNLAGGLVAWSRAGRPLVSATGGPGAVD